MHRFFLPANLPSPQQEFALAGNEFHHARNVCRLATGDRVAVFDGRGQEVTAEIVEMKRDEVILRALRNSRSTPPASRIVLAQAIPKGKNMDLIVQKAVELGVAAIQPLLSERTVVALEGEALARKREKWEQIAIEACKQCGQNWLPTIELPRAAEDFFSDLTPFDLKLVGSLQPDAQNFRRVLSDLNDGTQPRPASVLICIGPEGDFTPKELDFASAAGCRPVSLGPIVLRVETAAIFCLSVLAYELFS